MDPALLRFERELKAWHGRQKWWGHIGLDISDLDLPTLPYDRIPQTIDRLVLNHNLLTELDCARLPPTLTQLELLGNTRLARIDNLDALSNLKYLNLHGCAALKTLPPLPPSLTTLNLSYCNVLESLPPLVGTKIRDLDIRWTRHLPRLPLLPKSLYVLTASNSALAEFPVLPMTRIPHLDLDGSCLLERHPVLRMRPGETTRGYVTRIHSLQPAIRQKERLAILREELMMATWHPNRVSKWLEAGEDVLDMMMGC